MSFSEIRDQSMPVRLLRNTLRLGRIPNGLLFWGPGGVGKMLTARQLAKAVNCVAGAPDACGECLACRKAENGTHPDVKAIRPMSKSRLIRVIDIEPIIELASYRPFEGKRRIVIIEDVERMNIAAQNHFLKTLEEPPSDTTFVLVTEHPRRLLPTLRSRCQQVRFGALSPETVSELLLRRHDLPAEVAAAIAALSQGQMDRAEDLVESEKREVVLSITQRLAEGDDPLVVSEEFAGHLGARRDEVTAAAKEHMSEMRGERDMDKEEREELKTAAEAAAAATIRRDLMEYLYLLQTWYRDGLVYGATRAPERVLNRDQIARLEKESDAARPEKLDAIEQSWIYIERNLNIDRVFRDLFMTLAA